jgi:hypothetical protein
LEGTAKNFWREKIRERRMEKLKEEPKDSKKVEWGRWGDEVPSRDKEEGKCGQFALMGKCPTQCRTKDY